MGLKQKYFYTGSDDETIITAREQISLNLNIPALNWNISHFKWES